METPSSPPQRVFHLAIPTHDLDAAEDFYTRVMGARRARRYDDRVTFEFFAHQIVCHLAPEAVAPEVQVYPRHFGMTFLDKDEFDALYERCRAIEGALYQDRDVRWPERPERHETFFLVDPSNNVLEFKYYPEPRFVY